MEMIMKLRRINVKSEIEIWNNILTNSSDFYTIANNPSLLTFLKEHLGWSGDSFFIVYNNEIIGIYQHCFVHDNKAVSIPHFSYGGIIRKDERFDKKYIFNKIINQLPKQFEIRDFIPYTQHVVTEKIATFIELKSSHEEQIAFFKSNHRRKIKRAYKNGLEISFSSEVDDMQSFYTIYSKNMLRLGSPVLSEKFFLNLLKYYKYGDVKVFIVRLDNKVIGGAVLLDYFKFAEDCWLSTLSEFNYLYTGLFLYWEMIKYSINKKKKYFSFGRSTRESSLLNFKRQWKPIEKQLFFSHSDKIKPGLKQMKFLTRLWKLLPLKVSNYIGPRIAERLY